MPERRHFLPDCPGLLYFCRASWPECLMSDDLKQAALRYTGQHHPAGGVTATPVQGLYLVRRTSPSELEHTLEQALVCMVLQGSKQVITGSGTSSYAAGDTMIVTGNV